MHRHRAHARRLLGVAAVLTLALAPAAVASGGSGGGGTSTGGGGTSTGGGGTSTGGGGTSTGGGGTKPACTTTLSLVATATQALSGNSFSATYTLGSCQSKTKVALTATDVASGQTVYSSPDLLGTTAVWTLPYTLTSYVIQARAYSGQTGATLATASTIVSTADPVPCDPAISETVTTGYYGIYPAIWNATNAQNCLIPGTHTHLRITNLDTGAVTYDTDSPYMSWMLDYEGVAVPYDTPFEVDAQLVSSSGDVLASTTQYTRSTPLK
jgi:hypothetical protein